MLDRLILIVTSSESFGLAIVFFILLACSLGLPIPEDITIITSGILVSQKTTTFFRAFVVCMAGILIGDSIIYFAGRFWGQKLLRSKFFSKILSNNFIHIGEKAFRKFGNKIIFFARFLPGLRAPIYFLAGSMKTSYTFFICVDAVAALISVPVWIYVGNLFADNIDLLEKAIKKLQLGTILIVLVLVILLIATHFIKQQIIKMLDK